MLACRTRALSMRRLAAKTERPDRDPIVGQRVAAPERVPVEATAHKETVHKDRRAVWLVGDDQRNSCHRSRTRNHERPPLAGRCLTTPPLSSQCSEGGACPGRAWPRGPGARGSRTWRDHALSLSGESPEEPALLGSSRGGGTHRGGGCTRRRLRRRAPTATRPLARPTLQRS